MANRNRELPARVWNIGYPAGCGWMKATRKRSQNRDLGSYLTPVRDRRRGLPKILSPHRSQITDSTDASFLDVATYKQMFLEVLALRSSPH